MNTAHVNACHNGAKLSCGKCPLGNTERCDEQIRRDFLMKHGVGIRDNKGKTLWHLIPFEHMENVARLYTKGAEKYSEDNWKNIPADEGIKASFNALFRHLMMWKSGEKYNDEDFPGENIEHLASVIWNALAIMHYESTKVSK